MSSEQDRTKSAAVCEKCGEPITVWVWPDGRVQPVGDPGACGCEESELTIVGNDPLADAADEPSDRVEEA